MVEERELAWELLESARVIMSKDPKADPVKLAEIHTLLGDVSVEDGNFDRGYEEYTAAIKVYGKNVSLSDKRLAGAQQLAGICALYDQQLDAAMFHYTAAAECFNNRLTDLLVGEGIMEKKEEESEDIEFVDETLIDKLKEKVGEDSEVYKECMELNGIVQNLIDRVNEVDAQAAEDAQNPDMSKIVAELSQKLAEKVMSAANAESGAPAESGNAFDAPTTNDEAVNSLGTFGGSKKRNLESIPEETEIPVKKQKL